MKYKRKQPFADGLHLILSKTKNSNQNEKLINYS